MGRRNKSKPPSSKTKRGEKRRLWGALQTDRPPFYQPKDGDTYTTTKHTHFRMFEHLPHKETTNSDSAGEVLDMLTDCLNKGLFQRQVVLTSGGRMSITIVKRLLVGDEGVTYNYMGSRMFAYPWKSFLDSHSNPVLAHIGTALQQQAQAILSTKLDSEQPTPSIPSFNICLINFAAPNETEGELQEEPYFGMGKIAVPWHTDQHLEEESTIAVVQYTHTTPTPTDSKHSEDGVTDCIAQPWAVACKIAWDASSPALLTPLAHGDAYLMLHTFNHTHQHAVIAGTEPRFSLTYRRCVCAEDTLEYLRKRRDHVFAMLGDKNHTPSGIWTDSLQEILDFHTELEFGWLNQFALQGPVHARLNTTWARAMDELKQDWLELERFTSRLIHSPSPSHTLEGALREALGHRLEMRQRFQERLRSPLWAKLPTECRPMEAYLPTSESPLAYDLTTLVSCL